RLRTDVNKDELATSVNRGEHVRIVDVVSRSPGSRKCGQNFIRGCIRDEAECLLTVKSELTVIDVGNFETADAEAVETRSLVTDWGWGGVHRTGESDGRQW